MILFGYFSDQFPQSADYSSRWHSVSSWWINSPTPCASMLEGAADARPNSDTSHSCSTVVSTSCSVSCLPWKRSHNILWPCIQSFWWFRDIISEIQFNVLDKRCSWWVTIEYWFQENPAREAQARSCSAAQLQHVSGSNGMVGCDWHPVTFYFVTKCGDMWVHQNIQRLPMFQSTEQKSICQPLHLLLGPGSNHLQKMILQVAMNQEPRLLLSLSYIFSFTLQGL